MTSIATLDEFAYAIRSTTSEAAAHQLLLELAEGLVTEQLGELAEYPVSAKAVVLGVAARAYYNNEGVQQEELSRSVRQPLRDAGALGVYLTEDDLIHLQGAGARTPTFEFPGTWPYPDPVERPADTVSGP